MSFWKIYLCAFYIQNWPHHLPWFSSTGLTSLVGIPISIHGSIILLRKRAQQLLPPSLHFHLLHLHIPSTSLWVGVPSPYTAAKLPDLLCPFYQYPKSISQLVSIWFPMVCAQGLFRELPWHYWNIYPQCLRLLRSWSGLYQMSDYTEEWKPRSLAFKQNKLPGDVHDPAPYGIRLSLGFALKFHSCLVSSPLSFFLLYPYRFFSRSNASVNYLPKDPHLRLFLENPI